MKQNTESQILDALEKLLTREVAPVAPVLPVAPVAPILPITSTSADDHLAISNLTLGLANLDQKMTDKFQDIKNDIKGVSDGTASQLADHETRIRTSEAFQQGLTGKMSIIAGGISIIVSVISLWIAKQFGL